jgi:hypothetical protein
MAQKPVNSGLPAAAQLDTSPYFLKAKATGSSVAFAFKTAQHGFTITCIKIRLSGHDPA